MSSRTKVFLTIAGFALTMPVAAQAPAPTGTAMEWPEVDCRAAKLTTTASQPRCQRGPVFNPGGKQYTGYDCADEQWNVTARSATNFGFALLYNIRALVPGCAVSYPGGIAKALKGYPPFPTNGTGWSEVSQIGDIYTARFTLLAAKTARRLPNSGRHGSTGSCGRFAAGFAGFKGRVFRMPTCRDSSIA